MPTSQPSKHVGRDHGKQVGSSAGAFGGPRASAPPAGSSAPHLHLDGLARVERHGPDVPRVALQDRDVPVELFGLGGVPVRPGLALRLQQVEHARGGGLPDLQPLQLHPEQLVLPAQVVDLRLET